MRGFAGGQVEETRLLGGRMAWMTLLGSGRIRRRRRREGEAGGVDAGGIPGRPRGVVRDGVAIVGQLAGKVVPAHHVAGVVVAVHAQDEAAARAIGLRGHHRSGRVVDVGGRVGLAPDHLGDAPGRKVAERPARIVRARQVVQGCIPVGLLVGRVELLHHKQTVPCCRVS